MTVTKRVPLTPEDALNASLDVGHRLLLQELEIRRRRTLHDRSSGPELDAVASLILTSGGRLFWKARAPNIERLARAAIEFAIAVAGGTRKARALLDSIEKEQRERERGKKR